MTISYLIDKLQNLTPETKPLWGKMTAQHMVEHLIDSFRLSNGKIQNDKCMTPEARLPLMKKILMSNRPMPKNFVNPVIGADLKPLEFKNLNESIEVLNREVVDMNKFFELNKNVTLINPTFGPLNKEEWIQFHKKHLTHHLSQFGLIEL